MLVRELMNRHLVTIRDTSSCRDAVTQMNRARIRHLPVLSGDGALVGVITDRDLRHLLLRSPKDVAIGRRPIDNVLQTTRVADVMSAPPICIESSADVEQAVGIIVRRKIGSLPVVESARLVGIVTETDILREMCRDDADCSPEVSAVVVSYS